MNNLENVINETYYQGKLLSQEDYENNPEAQAALPSIELFQAVRSTNIDLRGEILNNTRVTEKGIHFILQNSQTIEFLEWKFLTYPGLTKKIYAEKQLNDRVTCKIESCKNSLPCDHCRDYWQEYRKLLPKNLIALLVKLGINPEKETGIFANPISGDKIEQYRLSFDFYGEIMTGEIGLSIIENQAQVHFSPISKNVQISLYCSTVKINEYEIGVPKLKLDIIIDLGKS